MKTIYVYDTVIIVMPFFVLLRFFRCPLGTYGNICFFHCLCAHNATCDSVTGACLCPPGTVGSACEFKCPFGSWCDQCSLTCDCKNGADCDPATGVCKCLPG